MGNPSNEKDTTHEDLHSQVETLIANAAQDLRQGKDARELLAGVKDAAALLLRGKESGDIAQTLDILADSYWDTIKQWAYAAPTGVKSLDSMLGGGFLPGRIIGLLGAPGMGKSSLATQISVTLADHERPVVYLTSEDTPHMLLCRALALFYNMNYGDLLRGRVDRDELAKNIAAFQRDHRPDHMLVIEQRGAFDLTSLAAKARQHFNRFERTDGGQGLLVIDYLQRLARSMPGQELRLVVSSLTEQLRDIARDLDCTVLALASQNREAYKSGGSNGSQLASGKESGDLEYACDAMMAIVPADSREVQVVAAPGHVTRVLRVDKNRQGVTGAILVDWNGARQMFCEVE